MGRLELEFPRARRSRSVGLRPSAFIDAGSPVERSCSRRLTDIVGRHAAGRRPEQPPVQDFEG